MRTTMLVMVAMLMVACSSEAPIEGRACEIGELDEYGDATGCGPEYTCTRSDGTGFVRAPHCRQLCGARRSNVIDPDTGDFEALYDYGNDCPSGQWCPERGRMCRDFTDAGPEGDAGP